jgi:hypothetical protein
MKNKLLIILVVLIVPLLACSESGTQATSSIITDIAGLKAKEPIWDSYGPRLTSVEARPNAQTSVFDPQSLKDKDSSLQSQIDTMKASYDAQVAALTSKVNNLTPGTGGGAPTSDTGTVIFTNNPASIPQIFSSSSGGNSNPWIMTIKNNSSTWQYVKPMVSLNVASGQPSSVVTDVSLMTSGGSCSLTGTLSVPGNFTFSPSNMATVATPSVIIFPISGCNGSGEWYIGPGQSQSYNIQIQGLKTTNPILWNVSASISSRSM